MKKLLALILPAVVLAFTLGHATEAQAAGLIVTVSSARPPVARRVWVPGHFIVRHGRSVWVGGNYRLVRAPARFVPGYWTLRAGRRVWRAPTWR